MKRVEVYIEALVEQPDDQADSELMDRIYTSDLGLEGKAKVTKISLPGIVHPE